VRAKVDAVKADIVAGKKKVWSGPIVKQDGTTVAKPGENLSLEAIETMDFLIQGVTGSTS
jgi:basic membrane protein A